MTVGAKTQVIQGPLDCEWKKEDRKTRDVDRLNGEKSNIVLDKNLRFKRNQ